MNRLIIAAAMSLFAAEASAQDVAQQSGGIKYGSRSGSVYSSYGSAAFVRGGYGFASKGGSPFEEGFSGSIGYRRVISQSGRSAFSIEGELLYARNSEDQIIPTVPVEATAWALTGLVSLRWDYAVGAPISPFASVGVGPSYMRGKVVSPLASVSDDDVTFAYSGRAGVVIGLSDNISLEPAYRYIGTTQSGAPGVHSAEVGFNLNF